MQSHLMTSAVVRLRAATRPFHDLTDTEYSSFDLSDRRDYTAFLLAHARATRAAEAVLHDDETLPTWRPRAPLLADDLDKLGCAMPAPLAFEDSADEGWRWGVLYVLEGSRLGGAVLVSRADRDAPVAFLSARHAKGEWRTLLAAIDARGAVRGPAWIDGAIAGASACFQLYRRAAKPLGAGQDG